MRHFKRAFFDGPILAAQAGLSKEAGAAFHDLLETSTPGLVFVWVPRYSRQDAPANNTNTVVCAMTADDCQYPCEVAGDGTVVFRTEV